MLKFSYWSDEDWGKILCKEQEQKCRKYFKSILKDYYTNQQQTNIISTQTVNPSVLNLNDLTPERPLPSSDTISKKLILGVSKKRLMSSPGNTSTKKRPITRSIDDLIIRNNEIDNYIYTNDENEFPFEGLEAEEADNVYEFTAYDLYDNSLTKESIEETGYTGEEAYESSVYLFTDKGTNIYTTNGIKLRTEFEYSNRPLSYWQQKQYMYPTLSLLAAKILGVCATSVPSERLFSQAKGIINNDRSKLDVIAFIIK